MVDVDVPVIFVIGGPGSGKGTQSGMMAENYGFTHLSTGDLLRTEIRSGSERGTKLIEIMTEGLLVPNSEVLDLLKNAIVSNLPDSKGFLIDGFPRELAQAISFENDICPCTHVLFFDLPDGIMKERLLERGKSGERADDNEETIEERLKVFHQYTQPILDHFEDKVKRIDAVGSPHEVFNRVCEAINDFECYY